jgi:hypothetical protein
MFEFVQILYKVCSVKIIAYYVLLKNTISNLPEHGCPKLARRWQDCHARPVIF